MKRTDIVMTEELKSFLAFDLGHMNEDAFPNKRTDIPDCDAVSYTHLSFTSAASFTL